MKTFPTHAPWHPVAGLHQIPLLLVLLGLALPSRAMADQVTLIDVANTAWRFNDSGADLGTAWRQANYPDETNSTWSVGTGLFGLETTDPYPPLYPAPIHTPLVLGAGRITYYFRTRFFVPQDPASVIVDVNLYADDGAVAYVNGTEVGRVRLPTDPVLYDTRAQLATPEGLPLSFVIPASNLVLGTNTIAVEVHVHSASDSDVVFGLGMTATGTAPPTIVDPTEPADRTVNQGEPTTFSVVGAGIPAPLYRWFHNNVLVPGANGPTLSIGAVGGADAGAYFAVLSNNLGVATSRTAVLTYIADTNPPSILYALARPQDLTSYILPFSEVPNYDSATDTFNWGIRPSDGNDDRTPLNIISAILQDETNLVLTTFELRDTTRGYVVYTTSPIPDRFGNELPADTMIPVALYPVELINSTNSWRFEHSGTDFGTSWFSPAFDDAGWSNGPAPLDVFRASADAPEPHCRFDGRLPGTDELVGTCLGSLSNATGTAQYSAAYFRTRFNFNGDAAHTVLSVQATVDDGAAFYLNGTELFRLGLPDGPVSYATLANRTVGLAVPEFRELAPRGLVQGENVLAVEVHQDSLLSADLTLGMSLTAIVPSIAAARSIVQPQLSSARSGGNFTISWNPAVGRLQSATEVGGPWNDVAQPSNPYTEPVTGPRKFYRVAVP